MSDRSITSFGKNIGAYGELPDHPFLLVHDTMSEESVHARSHHIGNITIVTDPKEGAVRMEDHNQEIVLEVDEEPEKMYHAFLKAIIDRVEYAEKYAKALSQAKMFLSWLVDSNKLDGHQAVAKEKIRHITQVLEEGPHEKSPSPDLQKGDFVQTTQDIEGSGFLITSGTELEVTEVPSSERVIAKDKGGISVHLSQDEVEKVSSEEEWEEAYSEMVQEAQERGEYDDIENVYRQVKDILVDKLGLNSRPPKGYNIRHDLGADSLDLMEIVMTMESEFDITITDEEAQSIKTVGDLGSLVHQKTLF